MKKREFIKLTGIVGAGVVVSPFMACNSEPEPKADPAPEPSAGLAEFTLPDLGYHHAALEPAVDMQTMQIHHGKHHAGYVKKLNKALGEADGFGGMSLEEIVSSVGEDQTGVRNNGGGHYNHSLFWKVMAPGGGTEPSGALAEAMNASFGDFETFKSDFFTAAKTRFGSGWAWMSVGDDGQLFISSTPNQDNPLMNFAERNGRPILGIDVWEHAYYLNYQNRRGDYINAFTDIINWDQVAANLAAI